MPSQIKILLSKQRTDLILCSCMLAALVFIAIGGKLAFQKMNRIAGPSMEEIRLETSNSLTIGMPRAEVMKWLDSKKIDYGPTSFGPVTVKSQKDIYAQITPKQSPFLEKCIIMLTFAFDKQDRLIRYGVNESCVGP